jgi:hypothetical protein
MTAPSSADADAAVVHHAAGVDDGAMPDRDVLADDARDARRDVKQREILHVGVAPHRDVRLLVSAHDGAGPDAHALVEGDVADDLGRDVDVSAGVDARGATGNRADHGGLTPAVTGALPYTPWP